MMHCAIIYDFDGTLAKGDCAQHGLMPAIGINDHNAFWVEVKRICKDRDGDEILTYLGLLALHARKAESTNELSVERLRHHGKSIPLFPGVNEWFTNINTYANDNGIALSHYIISSGLEEMIMGTPISKYFKKIFACKYHYDEESGDTKWPSVAINYTTKTQYLFRINKGVENSWDNKGVNQYVEPSKRSLPFDRMIFIGDGDTDIPSMKMVKSQGGCSLAVFDPDNWGQERTQEKIEKLISENRVSYVVPGDYQEHSQLDVTIKGVLKSFRRKAGE